ncbi:uncharacterized protein LOC125525577 [Triticum urartu]|uniref:uncharacterized protein LOC125525577 n=1 Tax=Triticum urartu TaxID=4572 RepID=UPI0020442E70|nr:uncharacterized protein LOC125525577 [Triticum urartu]
MGGFTILAASVSRNLSVHAAKRGVLPSSMTITPNISLSASSQKSWHPSARSKYPMESPPEEKAEQVEKASSMGASTASVAASFCALSSSVAARRMASHAGNSLSST